MHRVTFVQPRTQAHFTADDVIISCDQIAPQTRQLFFVSQATIIVEPQFNELPRNQWSAFVISRFYSIEVLSLTITLAGLKNSLRYIEDFVKWRFAKWRFHCISAFIKFLNIFSSFTKQVRC